MSASLEDMAERAEQIANKFRASRTFEEARAALNEAGMLKARARLDDALQRIADAQTALRSAQELASIRKSQLDQALAETEWELDYRFETVGNKTFLVDGDDRKAMTADERARWKQAEARKDEAVQAMAATAAGADGEVARCRDDVALAEKGFQAARADLDAAIATVGILAASIKGEAK